MADAKEMFELVRREGGYMYQTHPRTKGSTGFPDEVLTADYFRDASYLGVGWKAMPSDLSPPRLGDRVFDLVDEPGGVARPVGSDRGLSDTVRQGVRARVNPFMPGVPQERSSRSR